MKQHPHSNRSPAPENSPFPAAYHGARLVIVTAALILALQLFFGATSALAQSVAPVAPVAPNAPALPGNLFITSAMAESGPVQLGNQSYFDGLTVKAGEAIEGDAVVYKGDAHVQSGGRINGGLVAYAGDVRVDAGAVVTGDVTAWSGDVEIQGRIEGSLSVLSGDVRLGNSASVGGDVSVLSGDISRSDGARVGGEVVRGPKVGTAGGVLGLDATQFSAPAAPDVATSSVNRGASWFVRTLLRLLLAGFLTILLTLGALLVFTLRPQTIAQATDELRANPTRSFATGIVVMGALWLATFLLSRAFCFAVLSVIPGIASFALGAVGFTVVARAVGNRLAGGNAPGQSFLNYQSPERRPILETGLGALLVAAIFMILGALIGGLWGLALVVPVAPGAGAFLSPWFEKYRNRKVQDLSSPGRPVTRNAPHTPAPAPVAPPAPPAPPVPVAPASVVDFTLPAASAPVQPTSGLEIGDLVAAADADALRAAEAAAQDAAAREQLAAMQSFGGDDLTQISGIGLSWERKLKAAGVLTYGQLAALPVELAATILGVQPEEVIEDKILQQAADLTASRQV